MKQINKNNTTLSTLPSRARRAYITPCIELIVLDNEISLALESTPPGGPGEGLGFNENNPFKAETGLV